MRTKSTSRCASFAPGFCIYLLARHARGVARAVLDIGLKLASPGQECGAARGAAGADGRAGAADRAGTRGPQPAGQERLGAVACGGNPGPDRRGQDVGGLDRVH
jgi:hypothetical protein